MKLSVLQERLVKGISAVTRVVSSKPTLPILSNILLETKSGSLILSATDLNLGIKIWIGAKVKTDGKITVPAKVFGEIISSFSPSRIDITVKENVMQIACGGNKVKLSGTSAEEFPILGDIVSKKSFNIKTSIFSEAVERVVFSASSDETRPVLSGVYWKMQEGKLQLVATDGYRLSIVDVKEDKKASFGVQKKMSDVLGKGMIIPARAMRDVLKLLDEFRAIQVKFTLADDKNLAVFKFADGEVTTRLIEGSFPNFSQVIPKEEVGNVEVEIEQMEKAVRTASIFARDSANIVHWDVQKEKIIVSANAPAYGQSESDVEAKLSGRGGKIAFNSRYLLELFSVIKEKSIVFGYKGGLDPGVFRLVRKKRDEFLHIIMPVRVQK